jgi:hypothetical protein
MPQPVLIDPADITDTLWVRIVDSDHGIGNTSLTQLKIDWITLRKVEIVPSSVANDLGSPVNDVSYGDMDDDGDIDVVAAADNVYVLWNEGEGTADLAGDQGDIFVEKLIPSPGTVNCVDVGNFDEKDDVDNATLDIAAAYGTNVVYYHNDDIWTVSTVNTMTNTIVDLEAGDVNGDKYDDIVFIYGTPDESGEVDEILFYYQNDGESATWTDHVVYVKDFGTLKDVEWFAVDIGDVDRGILQ